MAHYTCVLLLVLAGCDLPERFASLAPVSDVPTVDFDVAGPFEREPGSCAVSDAAVLPRGLLDVGAGPDEPNAYWAAFRARGVAVSANVADVFFTAGDGSALVPVVDADGQPLATSAAAPEQVTVGGVAFNEEQAALPIVAFALVSVHDALVLPQEPHVAAALADRGFADVVVHAIVEGFTGDDARAISGDVAFPLTICAGCLVTAPVCFSTTNPPSQAQPIVNPARCARGNDVPAFVCP